MANYTKNQRRLIHKALVEAKPHLLDKYIDYPLPVGMSRYICYCIDMGKSSNTGKDLASDIISKRLGSCAFVTAWLKENTTYSRDVHALTEEQAIEQVQLFRHRWLDALIEEFSK